LPGHGFAGDGEAMPRARGRQNPQIETIRDDMAE
jgi:hypothetical protein